MEILGIGMPELIFIIVIALIVLGPKDMQKAGRTIGKFLRDLVTSDGWKAFQQTSREIRTLPTRLMREANDELNELNKIGSEINASDPARARSRSIGSAPPQNPPPTPASTVPPAEKSNPAPTSEENKSSIDDQDKNA